MVIPRELRPVVYLLGLVLPKPLLVRYNEGPCLTSHLHFLRANLCLPRDYVDSNNHLCRVCKLPGALGRQWELADDAPTAAPTAEQLRFFEQKVRPLLVAKCYECHSATSEKLNGGLKVDHRQGLLVGGDNGPAVVPGKRPRVC